MHFFGDPGNENRSTVPVARRFPARARNAYNIILILYILSLFGGGGVAYFRKRNSARKIHSGKMSVGGPQSASSARVVDKKNSPTVRAAIRRNRFPTRWFDKPQSPAAWGRVRGYQKNKFWPALYYACSPPPPPPRAYLRSRRRRRVVIIASCANFVFLFFIAWLNCITVRRTPWLLCTVNLAKSRCRRSSEWHKMSDIHTMAMVYLNIGNLIPRVILTLCGTQLVLSYCKYPLPHYDVVLRFPVINLLMPWIKNS